MCRHDARAEPAVYLHLLRVGSVRRPTPPRQNRKLALCGQDWRSYQSDRSSILDERANIALNRPHSAEDRKHDSELDGTQSAIEAKRSGNDSDVELLSLQVATAEHSGDVLNQPHNSLTLCFDNRTPGTKEQGKQQQQQQQQQQQRQQQRQQQQQ